MFTKIIQSTFFSNLIDSLFLLKKYIFLDFIELKKNIYFWRIFLSNLNIIQYFLFGIFFFKGYVFIGFIILFWIILLYYLIDYFYFLFDAVFFKYFEKNTSNKFFFIIYSIFTASWNIFYFIWNKFFWLLKSFILIFFSLFTISFWWNLCKNYFLFYVKNILKNILLKIDYILIFNYVKLSQWLSRTLDKMPEYYESFYFSMIKINDESKKKRHNSNLYFKETIKKQKFLLFKFKMYLIFYFNKNPLILKFYANLVYVYNFLNFVTSKWFWLYFFKLYLYDLFLVNIINKIKYFFINLKYKYKYIYIYTLDIKEKGIIFYNNLSLYFLIYLNTAKLWINWIIHNFVVFCFYLINYCFYLIKLLFFFLFKKIFKKDYWIEICINFMFFRFISLLFDIKYWRCFFLRFHEVDDILIFSISYIYIYIYIYFTYFPLYKFYKIYYLFYFKLYYLNIKFLTNLNKITNK